MACKLSGITDAKVKESIEMSDEKRRFSRIVFNVDAKLQIGEESLAVERIVNLSVGGCLIELQEEFAIDQECILTIALPHMGPGVEIYGKFIRRTEGAVSVQFTSISPENLNHLQNIIRYNAEDPEQIEDELSNHPGLK